MLNRSNRVRRQAGEEQIRAFDGHQRRHPSSPLYCTSVSAAAQKVDVGVTRQDNWIGRFAAWLDSRPAGAVVAAVFPEYRPDLVESLAAALGAEHLDFRREVMMPLGWKASSLSAGSLLEAAGRPLQLGRDVVMQNAEALLSLMPGGQRQAWLANALALRHPARLILPMALYAEDLPAGHCLVHTFEGADLPEALLLSRLSGLR